MLIEYLQFKNHVNKKFSQLSQGNKRKFSLIMSVIQSPDILLLDEVTTGVDLVMRNLIRDLLVKLRRQKEITILLSTHHYKDAEILCDNLLQMEKG